MDGSEYVVGFFVDGFAALFSRNPPLKMGKIGPGALPAIAADESRTADSGSL